MTMRTVLAILMFALVMAGCGSAATPGGGEATTSTTLATVPAAPAAPETVIRIDLAGGNVTPTNAELQAKVKEPIELRVNSDAADKLHVHSVPEHTFAVKPEPNQTFTFTVDVPGRVEVELHELGRTVAIIQVRP